MKVSLSLLVLLFGYFSAVSATPVVYPKVELKTEGQQFISDEDVQQFQDSILILKEYTNIHFRMHPAYAYLPNDSTWSQALENQIKQNFPVFNVVSTDIQETASSHTLENSRKLFDKYNPEVVIVALGENDGLYGKAIKEIKMYLSAVIQMAKNNKATVILVAKQLPFHYGNRYVLEFNNMYSNLASEYKVPFIAQQQVQQPFPMMYPFNGWGIPYRINDAIWPEVKKAIKKQNV